MGIGPCNQTTALARAKAI